MQLFAPRCTKELTAEVAQGRDRGGSGRLGSSGVAHDIMGVMLQKEVCGDSEHRSLRVNS